MNKNKVPLKPIAAFVLAALCNQAFATPALNVNNYETNTDAKDAKVSSVVITGSRIPRASLEGPTAVTIITAEELTKAGYKNVYDALANSVQNSGFTQGEDFGNTFTPSANTISLRGLGPNHTLILLDGRRLADFPIAYTGTVNFTNLANIPSNIVERIEILSGGASAVYGSDAIAGVINIVLKKNSQGFNFNIKLGDTERGGGETQRLQFSGTLNFDKLKSLFSIEASNREPLRATQRDFMAFRTTPSASLYRRDTKTGKYYDLGDTCSKQAGLFQGSLINYTVPKGSYCASPIISPLHWSVQTKNQSVNLFSSTNYEINENTRLFADFSIGKNRTQNDTRSPSWTAEATSKGYFLNKNTNVYETWFKLFSPEEIGGINRFNRVWNDTSATLNLGVKGQIPNTEWSYEAAYSASNYQSQNVAPRTLASTDQFILGPKLGTDKNGVNIYAPDPARLTKIFTPAEYDEAFGASRSSDNSFTHSLSFSANAEVAQLKAGPLKVATIAEVGSQRFNNTPDPRINQGYFNITTKSDIVSGERQRYAVGAEANIPLIKQVTASVATRYDHYSFADRTDGKLTYNTGLEIRPVEQILVRANYATNFRAPDMNYIFKSRGTGYYSSTTDYYRCKTAGAELKDCEFANYSPGANYVQFGNKNLKSEQGKSHGLGIVWSPNNQFDVSVDYWKIKISDMVTNLSADQLLRDEADCRTGKRDITSGLCTDTIGRIKRYPDTDLSRPGQIQEIWVNPINAAGKSTSGIDISGKYIWRLQDLGAFTLRGNYSKTLTQKSKQFAGDVENDDLNDLGNSNWRDKLISSLNWSKGAWSNTLTVIRYGKIPNGAGRAYLSPTGIGNFSTVYQANKDLTLSLVVNNVANKIKIDKTGGWPNYPVGSYSPVGRQFWIEANYKIGR